MHRELHGGARENIIDTAPLFIFCFGSNSGVGEDFWTSGRKEIFTVFLLVFRIPPHSIDSMLSSKARNPAKARLKNSHF